MWVFLQSAGKALTSLSVLFDALRKLYYEKKYGKIHDILEEVEEKRLDGTLADDDIRAANKRMFEQRKNLIP
jgi:hypothetical protein